MSKIPLKIPLKKPSNKSSKKRTKKDGNTPETTQDKNQLKRAALFYWSHAIYAAAENAGQAVGGFDNAKGSGTKFYCVVKKMKRFIEELNTVAATGQCGDEEADRFQAKRARKRIAVAMSQAQGYECNMDRDCPDGQICIYGDCESPFA